MLLICENEELLTGGGLQISSRNLQPWLESKDEMHRLMANPAGHRKIGGKVIQAKTNELQGGYIGSFA